MLAREIEDRQAISWATPNIALVLAKRGDYVHAIAGYERSLRNAWEIGDRWTACLNVAGLGSVNERLGRANEAESLYRKAIGFGLRLSIPSYLSGMLVGLARLLLAHGRAAEARNVYDEALAQISGVAGERLAGEDTRFDARVLGVRLRHALGESTTEEATEELGALQHLKSQVVGRGGMAALQNKPDVLHVRIQAPLAVRIKRYFDLDSHDPQLFDLIINTAKIKPADAADMIVKALSSLPAKAK